MHCYDDRCTFIMDRCTFRMDRCTFIMDRCTFIMDRCTFMMDRCTFIIDRCTFLMDRCTFIIDRCTFLMDRCTFMDLFDYKVWKSQGILARRLYTPRMTWGWVNHRLIFIFGWTIPLTCPQLIQTLWNYARLEMKFSKIMLSLSCPLTFGRMGVQNEDHEQSIHSNFNETWALE